MTNNLIKDAVKMLEKQPEGVLVKVYDDLVHPSTEPIGQIISYLPRTIRLSLSKWEKWIVNGEESLQLTGKAIEEKVKKIPEDKLCEPEPYVAVPTIQQIAYCFDSEELRNLYANLLASSMNVETKWLVHPGYVDIIKQLTPDEAKLLKSLPRHARIFLPLIDLQFVFDDNQGYVDICQNYTNVYNDYLDSPESINRYLENLERLKLIRIDSDVHITDSSVYEPIEKSEYIFGHKSKSIGNGKYEIKKKTFQITNFGESFIACCIDE